MYLRLRFQQLGSDDDLHKSIETAKLATDANREPTHRSMMLGNLLTCLLGRFQRFKISEDINRAMDVAEEVSSLTQDKQSIPYAIHMGNFGCIWHQKYLIDKERVHIDHAIDYTETALSIIKGDEQLVPAALCQEYSRLRYNLGSYLRQRYDQYKNSEDLYRGTMELDEAMISMPTSSIYMEKTSVELTDCLCKLYETEHSIKHLERATGIITAAFSSLPEGCTGAPGFELAQIATELGCKLGNAFETTGNIQYLDEGIRIIDISIKKTPKHHDNPRHTREQARLLARRYLQTGQLSDLAHATTLTRTALRESQTMTSVHADAFATLGIIEDYRFRSSNNLAHLDNALEYFQKSIDNTPETNVQTRKFRKQSWSTCNVLRFKNHDREIEILDDAIEVMQDGVADLSKENPNRSILMFNLADYRGRKFELLKTEGYAESAVATWRECIAELEALDERHVDRAKCWWRLGRTYQALKDPENMDNSIHAFRNCGLCDGGPPLIRIGAFAVAATLYAEKGDKSNLENSLFCIDQAIALYPLCSIRTMSNADKLELIIDVMGVGHLGAAIAVLLGRTAYEALKIFEAGRGIVVNSFLEARMDTSELELNYPLLSRQFTSAQEALGKAPMGDDVLTLEQCHQRISQGKHMIQLENRIRELLSKIREKPGFENFLQAPSEKDCSEAASEGPVVIINPSLRTHAFLVEEKGISVLELQDAKMDEMLGKIRTKAANSALQHTVLEWSWHAIAEPILRALGINKGPENNQWTRVWWILAGQLCYIPIHAAGVHVVGSDENVIDRVISSYSFSLTTMLQSRRQACSPPTSKTVSTGLLIAMSDTPGSASLPFAEDELEVVTDLCSRLGIQSTQHEPKDRESLLDGIERCHVFHFAGHGEIVSGKPIQSGLRFHDFVLTLEDIMSRKGRDKASWLSYLSACSTGESVVSPTPWLDEGLNLLNFFQLAGFRHAIGTVSEASDRYCVEVARVFYESLLQDLDQHNTLDDFSVALGLHKALRAIRTATTPGGEERVGNWKSKKSKPLGTSRVVHTSWWPYIHFGP